MPVRGSLSRGGGLCPIGVSVRRGLPTPPPVDGRTLLKTLSSLAVGNKFFEIVHFNTYRSSRPGRSVQPLVPRSIHNVLQVIPDRKGVATS